jgi:hypothetical protein
MPSPEKYRQGAVLKGVSHFPCYFVSLSTEILLIHGLGQGNMDSSGHFRNEPAIAFPERVTLAACVSWYFDQEHL